MEQVSTVLTVSITLMATSAGLLLSIAEGSPLAALTVPIGLLTWIVGDRRRGFELPRWALNGGGLLAIGLAVAELSTGNVEARLLSGGHLLVYLSWLLLLQPKQSRVTWWLAAVSVLQIAVASVLTSAPWFGAALLTWLLIAMWTMSIFTMQRAVAGALRKPAGDGEPPALASDAGLSDRSSAMDGVRPDDRFQLLSGRFAAGVAGITVAGLTVSLLFFLLIPRVWMSRTRFFDDTGLAGSGGPAFTDQVRLGDIGEIMGSNDVALELTFPHDAVNSQRPAALTVAWLGDSPLLRARTLETYRRGRWESWIMRSKRVFPNPPRAENLIRYDIRLWSSAGRYLFTAGLPVTCLAANSSVIIEQRALTDEFLRTDDLPVEGFVYSVFADFGSSAERPRQPLSWRDLLRQMGPGGPADYESALLQLPGDLRTLERMTAEALADLPADAAPHRKAQRLESYLKENDLFRYSLYQTVADPAIDPVEDFLANRRSGHCEYFASALTLMLRAARIPSRLVTGYKGGAWDKEHNRFIVLQRHAHAWVEARVDDGWITLDPTPAQRDVDLHERDTKADGMLAAIHELWMTMWTEGLGMNSVRQQEVVYEPLSNKARALWDRLRDFRGTAQSIGLFVFDVLRHPDQWISWQGGLTVFVLLAALALLVRGLLRLMSRLRRVGAAVDRRADRPLVPFFERFREIAGRAGLIPEDSQTAYEFGQTVGGVLNHQGDVRQAELPAHVIDEFYRVRFGRRVLSAAEEALLAAELDQLEDSLSSRPSLNSNGHDLRPR